jgi:hypothetical protein
MAKLTAEETTSAVSLHPLRSKLVYLGTSSMFLTIVLLPLLYIFNPPLDFDDFFRIIQQLLPVFVGFLLSAVTYAFGTSQGGAIQIDRSRMLNFILVSSFLFYWVGVVALTSLFLWSHSKYAPLNTGMPKEVFFTTLTILVSVITAVAGAISTKVFFEEYKTGPLPMKAS